MVHYGIKQQVMMDLEHMNLMVIMTILLLSMMRLLISQMGHSVLKHGFTKKALV